MALSLSIFIGAGSVRAQFERVRPQEMYRGQRVSGRAAVPAGRAVLLCEVIAAIAGRSNDQVLGTFPPYRNIELGRGERGLQQPSPKRQAVRQGTSVIVRAGVGRCRLRLDVID